jgi:pyrrolidone-carboxylate peptidase
MSDNNTDQRIYKVVVTGFGPFQNVPRNESWLAVSDLWKENFPSNIKLVTRELPVVYDIVKQEVEKLWIEENPDVRFFIYT